MVLILYSFLGLLLGFMASIILNQTKSLLIVALIFITTCFISLICLSGFLIGLGLTIIIIEKRTK